MKAKVIIKGKILYKIIVTAIALTVTLFFATLLSCRHTPLQPSPPLSSPPLSKELAHVELLPGRLQSQYESRGKKWAMSSQGALASYAGKKIFDAGGNIFDAAIATSFAIGVERPQSTGIGGGGFMLIYSAKEKKILALDFREQAPIHSFERLFQDKNGNAIPDLSLTGSKAQAIPNMVKGLLTVHKKFGKLPLAQVMQPAIEAASKGFPVYPTLAQGLRDEESRLKQFPSSRKIFFNAKGEPWPVGHKLVQKDLARTLERIAKQGSDGFYKGYVARQIVKSSKQTGGLITLQDLESSEVKWRTPVSSKFREFEIFSMPPPSSGGVHVIEILNILESTPLDTWGPQDPRSILSTAEAFQMAFADRAAYLGDTDFKSVPVDILTSKEYASRLQKKLNLEHALNSKEFPVPLKELPHESNDTTHFSIIDEEGNIVASTQTINGPFGSAMVIEGTGVLMNNEMDDFSAAVGSSNYAGAIGGKNNLIEPRKRPLSSMSPTIVLKNNQAFMGLGTPNSTKIITCVTLTLLNRLIYKLPLWDSMTALRYHHQWYPEQIQIEPPFFSKEIELELTKTGYKLNHEPIGCRVQAVERNSDGSLNAVSDPREEGLALSE